MSKNKSKKGVFAAIIAVVVVFAVVVSGIVVTALYNSFLKPTEFQFVAPVSGDGTGYYRHAYNELTDSEKNVYSVILQSIYTQPERIEIPQLGDGNLTTVFEALSYDNPDLFHLGLNCKVYTEGYKTYFETDYILDYADYTAKLQEAKDIASVIIDGASIYTSPYEKEKYVHDYIINHCSYIEPSESAMANNMYGCLVEGRASCEGYSRAFQYILNALNIDNRIVTGESADDGVNFTNHMWNYVVLENLYNFLKDKVDFFFDMPVDIVDIIEDGYSIKTAGGEYTCKKCDSIKLENEQEATGHDFQIVGEPVEGSCTEEGYTLYKCKNDGCDEEEKRDVTSAPGHDFGDWKTISEPRPGIPGKQGRKCAGCGKEETRPLTVFVKSNKAEDSETGVSHYFITATSENSAREMVTVYSYDIYNYGDFGLSLTYDNSADELTVKFTDPEGKPQKYVVTPGVALVIDADGKIVTAGS